jgi:hypothetical protein
MDRDAASTEAPASQSLALVSSNLALSRPLQVRSEPLMYGASLSMCTSTVRAVPKLERLRVERWTSPYDDSNSSSQ